MGISGISASSNYAAAGIGRGGSGAAKTLASPADGSTSGTSAPAATATDPSGKKLNADQQAALAKLQARDREVRQHELAHLSAAAGIAVSGPSYSYQRGPDGQNYAIGGEVHIDVSPGRTPQETLAKAQQIQTAALAPKDPSDADRAVAAEASQMAQEASAKLAQSRKDVGSATSGPQPGAPDTSTTNKVSRAYGGNGDASTVQALISAYA
jgi:hypothetical protein